MVIGQSLLVNGTRAQRPTNFSLSRPDQEALAFSSERLAGQTSINSGLSDVELRLIYAQVSN